LLHAVLFLLLSIIAEWLGTKVGSNFIIITNICMIEVGDIVWVAVDNIEAVVVPCTTIFNFLVFS
jgi:hypothetical protein